MLEIIRECLTNKNIPFENVLYVTKFGSELYGLNTGNSDSDLVCVYIPSVENLLLSGLESFDHAFSYKTKDGYEQKNTSEDIDVSFMSIQRLVRGLSILEVISCDTLFSYTNKDTVIYDSGFNRIFDRKSELLNIENKSAFIGYGINQVKKYGMKGTSLGIAEDILRVLDPYKGSHEKLEVYFESVVLPTLPAAKKGEIWDYIEVPDSKKLERFFKAFRFGIATHMTNITTKEFYERIQGFYNKFGERSKKAKNNEGIDWKASSHGLRSLINYYKLITSGEYSYPFLNDEKDLLLSIKLGQIPWEDYQKIFLEWVDKIEGIKEIYSSFEYEHAKKLILELYKK